MLVGVLLTVGREEGVPGCLSLRTLSGSRVIRLIRGTGDVEGLVSRETELSLQLLNIIGLKC